MKDISAIWVD